MSKKQNSSIPANTNASERLLALCTLTAPALADVRDRENKLASAAGVFVKSAAELGASHWEIINALVPLVVERFERMGGGWDSAVTSLMLRTIRGIDSGEIDINEPASLFRLAVQGACEETNGSAGHCASVLAHAAMLTKLDGHDGSGVLPLLIETAEELVGEAGALGVGSEAEAAEMVGKIARAVSGRLAA